MFFLPSVMLPFFCLMFHVPCVHVTHKFLTRTSVHCGAGSSGGGVTVDPVSLRSAVRQRLRSEVSHGCCCYFVIKVESVCRLPLCGSWEPTDYHSCYACSSQLILSFIHGYLLDSQVACLTFHFPLCISTTQLGVWNRGKGPRILTSELDVVCGFKLQCLWDRRLWRVGGIDISVRNLTQVIQPIDCHIGENYPDILGEFHPTAMIEWSSVPYRTTPHTWPFSVYVWS